MTRFNPLLVTGCYRSGTTIVEKVLHSHPKINIASQPFPVLYIQAKEIFLDRMGIRYRYPLDHRFLSREPPLSKFEEHLDSYRFSDLDLKAFRERMKEYKLGLWTPDILQKLDDIRPGTFHEIYLQLLEVIGDLYPKEESLYQGSKEVLIEEYIPYLLRKAVKVIVVVRDPRDMISSLNFREKDNLTGSRRPILFSLRAWRKSVAYCLENEEDENFLWFRYEDFINRPQETLGRVSTFLGLREFAENAYKGAIMDQSGKQWRGNSSFSDKKGLSTDSIGKYKLKMSEQVIKYIETICYPELCALAYPVDIDKVSYSALSEFREPFDDIHDIFPADYGSDPTRIHNEWRRLQILLDPDADMSVDEVESWFLNVPTRLKLYTAMKNNFGGGNQSALTDATA